VPAALARRLHKLRRAMVRPGRDRLSGRVEVDESFVGGRGGARGRSTAKKALIVVAAEEVGRGIGRIRMHRIPDASADCLQAFVTETIEPGSVIHTDGWHGYDRLKANGYGHQVTPLRGQHELASKLLPRVHRVVSLLKRWLLGTHQGAVASAHLDYYLDEFTFRFNRRTSRHPGKLFFRLAQRAVPWSRHRTAVSSDTSIGTATGRGHSAITSVKGIAHIPDILGRHALPPRRLARLGATPDFHHGLLSCRGRLQ
jgi:transposase-like protein